MFSRTFAAAAILSRGALSAEADTARIALGLGLSPDEAARLSLREIAVMKHDAGSRGDDRTGPQVDHGPFPADSQFAASAGVRPATARGRAFDEILFVKVRRRSDA